MSLKRSYDNDGTANSPACWLERFRFQMSVPKIRHVARTTRASPHTPEECSYYRHICIIKAMSEPAWLVYRIGGYSVRLLSLFSFRGHLCLLIGNRKRLHSLFPIVNHCLHKKRYVKTLDGISKGSSEPSPRVKDCGPPGTVRTRREGLKSLFVVGAVPGIKTRS